MAQEGIITIKQAVPLVTGNILYAYKLTYFHLDSMPQRTSKSQLPNSLMRNKKARLEAGLEHH
ncbi:hypothetical protein GCM10007418_29170 [Halopseudomonas salina]|uniref:Transposase n=1 Tax=Halopseudomonas salina TaxID=1323744 RepID=A0ABQ1PZ86_9GAMM|nr:hypothetical protein GCM10007418_29170 [Halopseudomonas salina]